VSSADPSELWWYHTIELPNGVVTKGWFDCRPVVDSIGFPASLAGKRCLDIGTFDGFWAYEMEKRGATDVTAIDVLDHTKWDWPPATDPKIVEQTGRAKRGGLGFEVARDALQSKVERIEMSVYDLDPEVHGQFDFIYMGSLILHLQDPVRALDAVRRVCRGEMVGCEGIDLALTLSHPRAPVAVLNGVGRPWWWSPNLAGLAQMYRSAGFEVIGKPKLIFMPIGAGQPKAKPNKRWLKTGGFQQAVETYKGSPHGVIHARPAV
jgi:tRNA (mo5U34)-methyltransferase